MVRGEDMKRFHTQGKYDKAEFQKNQQRQKVRTEDGERQGRRSRKNYSNGHKEYFTDENESIVMNNFFNQVERKSMKTSSQTSVKESRKHNVKKPSSSINILDEFPPLNAVDINSEFSETRSSNNKINVNDFPPLNEDINNRHSKSKKQGIKNNVPKKCNTRISFKDEFPPSIGVNINTELSETRSNKRIDEDLTPLNQDIDNAHSEAHWSRSQNYNATAGESNQSSGYNNGQNVKCDLPNENIHSKDLSANNVYAHKDRKANLEKDDCGMANDSQKAVPFNKPLSYDGISFSSFALTDLLYYNVNLMQDQQLFDFAFSLKCRILEKIYAFKYPERDELEFVCALTDGTQTEKNQRLITARTCCIVNHILEQIPETLDCLTASHLLQMSDSSPPQISDFPTSGPPQISDFPISHPPQISDFPISHPPQISDFPISHPPQISDFPTSSPPQISNFPQISAFPTASNHLQTSNSYNNNYESQVFETVQNSDLPLGSDVEFNRLSEQNNGQSNFNVDDVHKSSVIVSSVTEAMENAYVTKEPFEHNCMPIVNSEVNVPVNTSLLTYEDSTFSIFGLDNLLNYDVDAMQGHSVLDYSFTMKERILENILSFGNPVKEKLEFLCELTDGTQTESNQKLITARMCHLIINSHLMDHISRNGRNSSAGYSRYANPRRPQHSHRGRNY